MTLIIAIDPGHSKCGLLLADLELGLVLEGKVVLRSLVLEQIQDWVKKSFVERIILGNGTSSMYWEKKLKHLASVQLVEEKGTTIRARYRYWELNPPGRWLNWIPKGLRLPPENLDAFAALVLLEDNLNKKFQWNNLQNL